MSQQEIIKKLSTLIADWIKPLGFELEHLEAQIHSQRILRVFIDFDSPLQENGSTHFVGPPGAYKTLCEDSQVKIDEVSSQKIQPLNRTVSVEDCARVSHEISEKLESTPEMQEIFAEGGFDLEVSSPGIDRSLRNLKDYNRFKGKRARIHVLRPLSSDELENRVYQEVFPKQKNFVGVLNGVRDEKVILQVELAQLGTRKSLKKRSSKAGNLERENLQIAIPLSLITRAQLETYFGDILNERE